MQLKEFINYRVETIGPKDTLEHAAQKMRDLDVGSLPVCEENKILGIVTDRDITIRGTAKGHDPKTCHVSEVMTPDVICCYENGSVEDAAQTMQQHQIRRLFIINDERELVGVTSIGELATASGDRQLAGATLERISESVEQHQAEPEELESSADNEDGEEESVSVETRVTGLFDDSEQAKEALEELKDAGFADEHLAVAMKDGESQENLISQTGVRTAPADELPSLPELDPGQVLVMVEAADRAALALEIINRNRGVTGGVRS